MDYFKNVLPTKKQNLMNDYISLEKEISDVVKYLEKQNVVQAKVALGKVYMALCEIKPQIEESFYTYIQNAKFRVNDELKPSFFGKYSAQKIKSISEDFKQIRQELKIKIEELSKKV